jgi:hypothetical protein
MGLVLSWSNIKAAQYAPKVGSIKAETAEIGILRISSLAKLTTAVNAETPTATSKATNPLSMHKML